MSHCVCLVANQAAIISAQAPLRPSVERGRTALAISRPKVKLVRPIMRIGLADFKVCWHT
ncbi:hypothetical protein BN2497_10783 [Janthinobacterium sp. CG23_2]|nr:hypothetical protein BN2497_10783 [Janthinobacterium sp. CG23_2]CUU31789.1 hypothetical protein BN3177_10783 [Janthinobacterium sp. CG23_2]